MTKKQFEKQLKQQAYAAVPDKLSDLMKTIAAENDRGVSLSDNGDEPHLAPVVPAHSSQTVNRWLAIAACFVMVLCAVLVAVTHGDDTQLTRGEEKKTTTATTVNGVVPSVSVSGDNHGSTTASVTTATSQNETTALSASSGTQTANGSGMPSQTGGTKSRVIKGATTALTTRAPTRKPGHTTTTRPAVTYSSGVSFGGETTVPTTKRVCSHQITYKVPVMIGNGEIPADRETCVQYGPPKDEKTRKGEVEPTEPSAVPAGPTIPAKKPSNVFWSDFSVGYPTREGECTFYVEYEKWEDEAHKIYEILTGAKFMDGWKITFRSVCEGSTVLYTELWIITDKGVCVEEQRYDPATEVLTVTRRNEQGETIASYTKKVAKGSKEFAYMGVS